MSNNNYNEDVIVYSAKNVQDLLYLAKAYSDLCVVGGCTYINSLPQKTVSIRQIPELSLIECHERFVNFGPGVTLNEILNINKNRLPATLYEAVSSVSNPFVRNLATLGGNICAKEKKLTLYAPLLAMDSILKIRNQEGMQNIPMSKYTQIPSGNILINIKVPIEDWDVTVFRKLGSDNIKDPTSASYCFLASMEKDILVDIRIAFAGVRAFRNRELEDKLIGFRLPISTAAIADFISDAGEKFDQAFDGIEYSPILKQQFLNLTQYSIHQLT